MKKILLIILATLFSYGQIITIIDNGTERKIDIPNQSANRARKIIKEGASGIIIAFKKGIKIDIKNFAKENNLKLRKKLIAGYYLFDNISTDSDILQILKIAKKNRLKIKTIRPNWGLNNKPR